VFLFMLLVQNYCMALNAQVDVDEVALLDRQLLQLGARLVTKANRKGSASNHGQRLLSPEQPRRPQNAIQGAVIHSVYKPQKRDTAGPQNASKEPVIHSAYKSQKKDNAGPAVTGGAWIDQLIETFMLTEDARGTTPWLSQVANKTQAQGEVSPVWVDRLFHVLTIFTRVILISLFVCLGLFCYCCGIVEDVVLCCGLFSRFNDRTKQYVYLFILLNAITFLAVWQVWFLRPVLYICVVLGMFCSLCFGCVLVVAMELLREARATFNNGVQFLGYLDDKVDDMLDYFGLSEASSDDDVTHTCWGGRVRRAAPKEKKTAEAPKLQRPLVGERQSKPKKPRAGTAKGVK